MLADLTKRHTGFVYLAHLLPGDRAQAMKQLAATRTTVVSAAPACRVMRTLAQTVSGIVSVGLKAVEFVNET